MSNNSCNLHHFRYNYIVCKGGNTMILACHGINKSFGENVIVADGSFHIEDHEKAALVGPNGAGKSTL